MNKPKRGTERPPLFNLEMERYALASAMLDENGFAKMMGVLKQTDFYERRNQIIWDAYARLFSKGASIDLITTGYELEQMGELENIGGDTYLIEISGDVIATAAFCLNYAKIVRNYAARREFILALEILKEKAYEDPDINGLIEKAIDSIASIHTGLQSDDVVDVERTVGSILDKIGLMAKEGKPYGLPTGLPTFDKWTGGLRPSKLYTIGARPAIGKTDTMINWVLSVSKSAPVGIISAEMDSESLIVRMVATFNKINSQDVQYGCAVFSDEWYKYMFGGRKIYVCDKPAPTVIEIRARTAILMAQKKISVLFIDHLHELKPHTSHQSEYVNWKEMVKFLRDTARIYCIPIVLFNQLSREGAKHGRPQLQHLRQAGEEESDVVILLYREAYKTPSVEKDILEFNVAKHRAGRTGVIYVNYTLTSGAQVECDDQEASRQQLSDDDKNDSQLVENDLLPF